MSDPRTSPSSIFTRGAVDLSALKRPVPATPPPAGPAAAPGGAPAGAAGTPPGGGGPLVIDVSEATFQSEVLERSLTTPVVIDFWADWCGPCKQLSPVLEKLAVEGGGAWTLAKVDVDANPRLAQIFRVQGIPLVIGIVGGQPVDAFSGVLPEAQLRQWLAALLDAAGVASPAPEDPRLDAADDALLTGDLDAAEAVYRKILAETPGDEAAQSGLAQVALSRRAGAVDPAAAVAAADAAPDDVPAQLAAADVEVLAGRAAQAYERLTALVRRLPAGERDAVREHLLSLFAVAGPDDPAVAAARRALASALF